MWRSSLSMSIEAGEFIACCARAMNSIPGVSDPQRASLTMYAARLLLANRGLNLTGAKDVTALVPHILDSLTVVPYVSESLIDVGSGGGLPAIPLAICCGVPTTMIEAVGKKAAFLRQTVEALNLEAQVLASRAEVVAFEVAHRERYLTATGRAVALAPTLLEYLMPFLAIGGRAILQRGSLDERERQASADAALVLGGRVLEEVPLEGTRRLLIVTKERETPLRFPRKAGVPQKRPLCYL
jgi:16S rRNA (guanine527-N7)-methyltransferase